MRTRGLRIMLKSAREIQLMRESNVHAAEILATLCEAAKPGVSTWELDHIARREIKARKVKSAFLGYNGFKAVICASVNEEIVHGIPRKDKILIDGDIITLDFGVVHQGYVSDTARTVAVGNVSPDAQKLIDVTRESLDKAIALCTPEHRLSDIGKTVQDYAEAHGFGVVRDFAGHGVGMEMHEDPQVLNYYDGPKPRMRAGLVIAIEPMLTAGTHKTKMMPDGWTVVTADGKLSAHFEDSIAITDNGPWVLSRP